MPDLKAQIRITLIDEANRAAARVSQSFAKLNSTVGGVSATGQRASQAIARLAQAQASAGSESAALSAKLARLQASGSASQSEIASLQGRIAQLSAIEAQAATNIARFEGRIEKLGGAAQLSDQQILQLDAQVTKLAATADNAGARMARLAKSAGNTGGSLKKVATGTTSVAKGSKRLSKEQRAANLAFAEGINLTTELGFGMLSLSKKTMPLGIALAGAGNNAFSFARFLGPLGIGLGVAATAIPGVIGLVQKFGDETDKAAEANRDLVSAGKFTNRFFRGVTSNIDEATEAGRGFLSLIDEFSSRQAAEARQERILSGQASVAETKAAEDALRAQRTGEGLGAEGAKKSVAGQVSIANEQILKSLKDRDLEGFGVKTEDLEKILKELQDAATSGDEKQLSEGAAKFINRRIVALVQKRRGATAARAAGGNLVRAFTGSKKLQEAVGVVSKERNRAIGLSEREEQARKARPVAQEREDLKTIEEGADSLIARGRETIPKWARDRYDKITGRARDENTTAGLDRQLTQVGIAPEAAKLIATTIAAEIKAEKADSDRKHRELIQAIDRQGQRTGGRDPLTRSRAGED